ncbi:MAG: alpha/beta hydrolase [bacterium]
MHAVLIPSGGVTLNADMEIEQHSIGVVIFALGTPGRCNSPRNKVVGDYFKSRALGTLFVDFLTPEEEKMEAVTEGPLADTPLLASRICDAIQWLLLQSEVKGLPIGLYGGNSAAAATLVAAAEWQKGIAAVVIRGGDPTLKGNALQKVISPTLLLVGEKDVGVIKMNEEAIHHLLCHRELVIIPGASHLFEEPTTKNQVLTLAADWFTERFTDWEHASQSTLVPHGTGGVPRMKPIHRNR